MTIEILGRKVAGLFLGLAIAFLGACSSGRNEVVVYTSLDRDISAPVLEYVSETTGLTISTRYDSELTKTTGLYLQLLAEKSAPRADLFWNSEVARTIQLVREGVLECYRSPAADEIPAAFKDPEGYWTGFAARARVIVFNTNQVPPEQAPQTLRDLLDAKWKGRVGVAKPFFGTTATHAAALFVWEGGPALRSYFEGLQANEARFLPGNATVRDLVGNGTLSVGLTDTDDVWGGINDGLPVDLIYLDADGQGTLLIPNTVALIRGGPNPEGARRVIDALLSTEVEARLSRARGRQIPLHQAVSSQESSGRPPTLGGVPYRPVDFQEVAEAMPEALELLKPLFP